MELVSCDANELSSKISKVKDVNCMTDNEVQVSLHESREWKDEIKALKEKMEAIMIDSIGVDIDEKEMKQFHEMVELVIENVVMKIDDLLQKDKDLCLYTLVPQRNEKCVHYPEPFGGEAHENVFAFIEDIKKAMDDDQIRTKSKVKVLKGNAKMRIAFAENVDEAFEILLTTFTTPDLLWEMKKEEITQAFGERNVWGPIESVQRRNTISKMISCLEEAKRLSSQHEDLKSLILSRTTYSFFYSLLPRTIKDDIISARSMNDTINEKFDILNKVLRAHLRYTVYGLDLSAGYNKVSQKFDTKSPPTEPKKVHVDSKSFTQHSCVKSPGCRAEWNKIGCIKLYHLKSVDERISFLKEMKCCVRCGRKFSKFHKCRKDRKLENAMCTKVECKLPSVLCNAHINDGNASPELRRWLSRNGIDPNVIFGTVKSEEMDDVCNKSHADVITNTSINMVNVNTNARKTCRPGNERYHANYFANNYRSNDENSPHNKSVKTDVDVTDVEELDIETGAENVNKVEMVCNDIEDNSNDGNAVGNARGKNCSQTKALQIKAIVHSEPFCAKALSSNIRKAQAENNSTVTTLKTFNDSSSKPSLIKTDGNLSNAITPPKVTTENLMVIISGSDKVKV